MNVLVTGSSGFIGSHLVTYLKAKDYNVWECDKKQGTDILNYEYLNHYKNTNSPSQCIIDAVVHLAAQTSVWCDDIEQIEQDNIRSFIHIFNICRKLNIKFIYTSSSCAINVTSMYGLSKNFDEQYFNLYKWDRAICLRLHNVYGANPRPDTLLGICMNNNDVLLYNNGENYRHFTYIDDVCKSIEYSLQNELSGIYNVYNPELTSTADFCKEVQKYKNLNIQYTNEHRQLDKVNQVVDDNIKHILTTYTSVHDGIRQIFLN